MSLASSGVLLPRLLDQLGRGSDQIKPRIQTLLRCIPHAPPLVQTSLEVWDVGSEGHGAGASLASSVAPFVLGLDSVPDELKLTLKAVI